MSQSPAFAYILSSNSGPCAGLADQWDAVKEAYAAANRALGNIVKVTPSSKVVGDLANFMVANDLDEHTLVERAADLSFPTSVIEFMQARRRPLLCPHWGPHVDLHTFCVMHACSEVLHRFVSAVFARVVVFEELAWSRLASPGQVAQSLSFQAPVATWPLG